MDSRVLFAKCHLMSVATEMAIQLDCKLSDEPWSVDAPVTSTLVTDYDVYREEGSRERLCEEVASSLDQGL